MHLLVEIKHSVSSSAGSQQQGVIALNRPYHKSKLYANYQSSLKIVVLTELY